LTSGSCPSVPTMIALLTPLAMVCSEFPVLLLSKILPRILPPRNEISEFEYYLNPYIEVTKM
jgi:hypothetical protein